MEGFRKTLPIAILQEVYGFPDERFTNSKRARETQTRHRDAKAIKASFAFRVEQIKKSAAFPTRDLQVVNEQGKTQRRR